MQDKTAGGTLALNLDVRAAEALREVATWAALRINLPYAAADMHRHRERLRVTEANAAAVIRLYNKVSSGPQ